MLELLTFFKGSEFDKLASSFRNLSGILEDFEENYDKDDSDQKNALIDTLCQILQAHKDV